MYILWIYIYSLFSNIYLQNEMTVTSIITSEGDECHITGVGYSSGGQIVFEGGYSELANEAVTKLLETGKYSRANEN